MQLLLTPEEREVLIAILREHHRELINEIAHTGHRHFKQVLLDKVRLLETVMEKLGALAIA